MANHNIVWIVCKSVFFAFVIWAPEEIFSNRSFFVSLFDLALFCLVRRTHELNEIIVLCYSLCARHTQHKLKSQRIEQEIESYSSNGMKSFCNCQEIKQRQRQNESKQTMTKEHTNLCLHAISMLLSVYSFRRSVIRNVIYIRRRLSSLTYFLSIALLAFTWKPKSASF